MIIIAILLKYLFVCIHLYITYPMVMAWMFYTILLIILSDSNRPISVVAYYTFTQSGLHRNCDHRRGLTTISCKSYGGAFCLCVGIERKEFDFLAMLLF